MSKYAKKDFNKRTAVKARLKQEQFAGRSERNKPQTVQDELLSTPLSAGEIADRIVQGQRLRPDERRPIVRRERE